MITEDYCSYELSKLLKEKGLNTEFVFFYRTDEEGKYIHHANTLQPISYKIADDEVVAAITHQMAMKWLREVHKLFVDISFQKDEDDSVTWFYMTWALDDRKRDAEEVDFASYEEAVEAALKYCLTELI